MNLSSQIFEITRGVSIFMFNKYEYKQRRASKSKTQSMCLISSFQAKATGPFIFTI